MKKIIITILFLITVLLFSNTVYAAELSIVNPSNDILRVGDIISVDLYLNTQNESINTIASTISYPSDILDFKNIYTGDSIVNIWIDKPNILKDGEIYLSGITPGGYNGDKGNIIRIIFEIKKSGNTSLKVIKSQLFRNDGKGTEIKAKIKNLQLNIFNKTNKDYIPSEYNILDKDLPETFVPEINKDPNIFDDKYFIVFNTQDKISGIDHYEICEGIESDCIEATSPYLLKDQELRTKIYVKAVDKSNNIRVVMVNPKNIPWYEHYIILAIILVICTFVIFSKKKIKSIFIR
jgi:hypothetical protein